MHRWPERSSAFDADVEARRRAADDRAMQEAARSRAKKQAEFRDEQVELGRLLIAQGKQMLERPLERAVKREKLLITAEMVGTTIEKSVTYEATRWTKDGSTKMLETGAKLTALGLGLATDSTELTGAGGSPLVPAMSGANTTVMIYLPEKKPLTIVEARTPAQLEQPTGKEENAK